MNTKLPCPYCSSLDGFIYVQSHYQCLTCKRVVDDCCGGETMDCMVPMDTGCTPTQNWQRFIWTSLPNFVDELMREVYENFIFLILVTGSVLVLLGSLYT